MWGVGKKVLPWTNFTKRTFSVFVLTLDKTGYLMRPCRLGHNVQSSIFVAKTEPLNIFMPHFLDGKAAVNFFSIIGRNSC